MKLTALLFAFTLLLAVPCEGSGGLRVARVHQAARSASDSETAWAALLQTESEDLSFWNAELAGAETALVQLQRIAEAPVVKNGTKAAEATAPKAKAVEAAPAVKPTEKTAKKAHSPAALDPAHLLASLGGASLNPKSAADLAPTLGMLKGLYEDSKDRIAALNAREQKSKAHFSDKEKEHTARLAKIEARFHNHTLSEEFHTNETRDETRMFGYWSRCRERQHKQFHTSLKIQHGMMSRVKTMVDMYEKTMAGGDGAKAKVQKELTRMAGGGMPDVVLLQDVASFCHEALDEVHAQRDEVTHWSLAQSEA